LDKKRALLIVLTLACALALLVACQGETQEVTRIVTERETVVEQQTIIEQQTVIEKETVVVAGTPEIVEKEVVVTATPEPMSVSEGGTIIMSSFSDAENLNPILWTDNASSEVGSMMYNALTYVNPDDLTSAPDLAKSWDISDDGLTFTFYLRDDVAWHDGAPFTAEDVKFTYDSILNPDINSIRRADLAEILTTTQIIVRDDYTIEFQLNQVDASFLCCKTTYGIIPKHILGELTPEEFNAAEFNTLAPIGTGQFMFREWVKDDHVALVKNPNYFEGAPHADFWYFKVVEDATVEFAQLQTGEVDYSENVTASLWEEALRQEQLNCAPYPQFAFTFYVYQLDPEKSTLFQDVRTRRALLMGLDRPAMVDSILFGLAEVADSVVPPISWAHNPDNAPVYGYDAEGAKQLLDEAGWRDEDGDGVREAHGVQDVEDGTPLRFELHTNSGNTEREQDVVAMQQFWAELGVDAQPTPIEWNALLAELTETYEYEMILVGFGWDIDPDQKTMWHTDSYGGGFNMNRYSNPELDDILDAALQTVDLEERKAYYYEMQRILAEDVPAPILYFKQGTGCANKRVHEIHINDIENGYNSHEWWVER